MDQSNQLNCDCIIVNYNAGRFLKDSVQSAFDNHISQVIVVDNHSTDDSLADLKQHSTNTALTILQNPENLGFAAACNIGLNHSQAEYLLFLNPDCILGSCALEALLEVLKSDHQLGMVGGFLCYPDGQEQAGGRRTFPTPKKAFIHLLKRSRIFPRLWNDFELHTQPKPDQPILVEAISGACMLVKRTAIDDVGLWDEGYFLHCEDLDWCMRFQLKQWKIGFVPQAIVTHAKGVCSASKPFFVEWHKHLGMLRFYNKFFYPKDPLILSVAVWLGIAIKWLLTFVTQAIKTVFKLQKPAHHV